MLRGISVRSLRSRVLCSRQSVIFLAVVVTVVWMFHALKISRARYKSPATETNPTSANAFRTKTIGLGSTTLPSNTLRNSTILTLLTSTVNFSRSVNGGFLSQTAPFAGTGQGNLMFMYASLLGIADTNHMTPVYPKQGYLRNIFNISALSLNPLNSQSVSEAKACAYDTKLSSLSKRPGNNVTAIGYLQSWKYFSAISDRVRREFAFVDRLRMDAEEFLDNISASSETTANRKVLYIGVHVRRRDMLASYNVVRGYTVATKEYLTSAVQYFCAQFPSELLVFVVCTDEVDWTKQNFHPPNSSSVVVVFSENRDAAHDMALLSACNHSIITVGTYGWWSAYLAGGRTVYYKNFPASGTHIANVFDKNDYYPPEWIGM